MTFYTATIAIKAIVCMLPIALVQLIFFPLHSIIGTNFFRPYNANFLAIIRSPLPPTRCRYFRFLLRVEHGEESIYSSCGHFG